MQLDKYEIINFDEIDSTNKYFKENYEKLNNNTIIKTLYQTNGKGQFDRVWNSNTGDNLLFSILLKDVEKNELNKIFNNTKSSLLLFLEKHGIKGKFKVPNDILVDGKKILGILIETKINPLNDLFSYVIVGIGLNVNQTTFNNLNATSFKLLTHKSYNLDDLFRDFINNLTLL